MFNGNAMPSLADIAAVTGNGRNNDGMWGGDGWWAIIIFAMIFGWWFLFLEVKYVCDKWY